MTKELKEELTLTLYRPNQKPILFTHGETLTIPELLPGWELQISELSPPLFEEDENYPHQD